MYAQVDENIFCGRDCRAKLMIKLCVFVLVKIYCVLSEEYVVFLYELLVFGDCKCNIVCLRVELCLRL